MTAEYQSNTEVTQKVISISSWKKENAIQVDEESMKKFYSSLSFPDLIAESNLQVKELKKRPLTQKKITASRLLMKEFKKRLGSKTTMEQNLNSSVIEQKILDFQEYQDQLE